MVDTQRKVYITSQARRYFSLTNSEFTLAN